MGKNLPPCGHLAIQIEKYRTNAHDGSPLCKSHSFHWAECLIATQKPYMANQIMRLWAMALAD
jgi:hypothetical protein